MTSALATIDAAEYRGFAARAWHAAGIAALAEGSYLTCYAQLSQLFGADGAPLHHHVSYLGIADLHAAAVPAERHLEARRIGIAGRHQLHDLIARGAIVPEAEPGE